MIPELLIEFGWSSGQKAAANFASKVATVTAAAVATKLTCNTISKQDIPLVNFDQEEASKVSLKRTFRDGCIAGAYSALGAAVYKIAVGAIESTDFI